MKTKPCTRGKHEIGVEFFSKCAKNKDGLMHWCKKCVAEYERERYQNGDRDRKKGNRANTEKRAQDYIWSVLTTSQCVDCCNDDPLVLEFDHRDGSDKLYNISSMYSWSVESIKKEITKCEVRCANCHKKKTAKQFGFWRSLR